MGGWEANVPFNALSSRWACDMSDAWDVLELAFGGDALYELLGEGVKTTFAGAGHGGGVGP